MQIWLAIKVDDTIYPRRVEIIGTTVARSEEEAFYKFMHQQLYPKYAVPLDEVQLDKIIQYGEDYGL